MPNAKAAAKERVEAANKTAAKERMEAAMSRTIETTDEQVARVVEAVKLKIAFYDRLLLLSGATVTLTFTATSTLHANSAKLLLATRFLILGWILLVYSILACIASNWLSISAGIQQSTMVMTVMAAARHTLLKMAVQAYKPDAPFPDNAQTPAELEKQARQGKSREIIEKISNYLGFSAQLAVCGAYILLLRFLIKNILSI
jgi:hypothetical protein